MSARAPSARGPLLRWPRHLVVRLPNPLGDAVMATPALRALRGALPGVRITWLGGRAAQAVLEGLPWRDDLMPLAGRLPHDRRGALRAAGLLRRLGADTALLLPNSFSSAFAARHAGIAQRIGTALHARGPLLTHAVDVPLDENEKLVPRPMTAHYLDLVRPFGIEQADPRTELATTSFDEERAALRLARLPRGVPLLGVNPGAAFGATKILPPARIAEAVARVRAAREVLPVVLCGPGEESLARETAVALAEPRLSLHEAPPDLGELKALIRRLAVLCTTDTGPRHVAEAFGVPTVVWMGPTDPRWSAGGGARVVRNEELPCLGCHLKTCPIGTPCMNELDPGAVAAAALAALGEGAAGGASARLH